jgi:hypothetical protein
MSKPPSALGAFVRDFKPSSSQAAPSPQSKAAESKGKVPRRLQSVVPFRLSHDDHRALKRLAAHDETSMQSMLFEAIQEYAATRGVKLEGD